MGRNGGKREEDVKVEIGRDGKVEVEAQARTLLETARQLWEPAEVQGWNGEVAVPWQW